MHYISYGAAKALADQRAREAEIRAAREELLRQAGLEPHGRIYGMACRVLCELGHGFVALGRRLERFDMNRPLSPVGSATTGR